MKPLLLVDIDGVLNPEPRSGGRRPEGYTTHRMKPSGWDQPWQKPLRVWLNPEHGVRLKALPYELAWCTTWEEEANEWIAPHLDLGTLPVVNFEETPLITRSDGTYFKTHDVVTFAAGRPFAWIDDQLHDYDDAYVTEHHSAPALLHRIDPFKGLKEHDFELLEEWAKSLDHIPKVTEGNEGIRDNRAG